jgi:hypothetical protein
MTGCYERLRVPPDVRMKIADKAAAARSIHALLERPAQRLIIGHGDIIEEGCGDRFAQAWRLEGLEVLWTGSETARPACVSPVSSISAASVVDVRLTLAAGGGALRETRPSKRTAWVIDLPLGG